MKFAKNKVFMCVALWLKLNQLNDFHSQTPTFNATPVVQAALETCMRGVTVEIYADLGFNDEVSSSSECDTAMAYKQPQGELLPFQGGTNQMVVMAMYQKLPDSHKQYLQWYWYTGKDQKQPLNAKDKSRNCHVKLMSEFSWQLQSRRPLPKKC